MDVDSDLEQRASLVYFRLSRRARGDHIAKNGILSYRAGEFTKDSRASFTCHLEAALRASGRAEGAPQDAERLAHPNGRLLLPKSGEVDQQVSLPVAMVRVSVCKEGGVAVEESLVIDDPEVLAHERVRLIQLDIGRLLPPLVKREMALRVNPIEDFERLRHIAEKDIARVQVVVVAREHHGFVLHMLPHQVSKIDLGIHDNHVGIGEENAVEIREERANELNLRPGKGPRWIQPRVPSDDEREAMPPRVVTLADETRAHALAVFCADGKRQYGDLHETGLESNCPDGARARVTLSLAGVLTFARLLR